MPNIAETKFIALNREHTGIIHKICQLYRDSQEDRKDLFQEITYQLWKSFPGFKGQSRESTWLYRVALNTALASFRKKSPPISYTDTLPDRLAEQPDTTTEDREGMLFSALKALNDGDKALMALCLEDLSYQEIADIMGIKENHVGVKINRLKAKIKKELNKQYGI